MIWPICQMVYLQFLCREMCKNIQNHGLSAVMCMTKDLFSGFGHLKNSWWSSQSAEHKQTWNIVPTGETNRVVQNASTLGILKVTHKQQSFHKWMMETSHIGKQRWSKKPNDTPWMLLASVELKCNSCWTIIGWKLLYFDTEPEMTAQARMGLLTSFQSQLANCVGKWISLGGSVCMLRFRVNTLHTV